MERIKYLIVGGGIAGTTAAENIRQNDPAGAIAIISNEPYPLYSRIMLSKPDFFLGKIPENQIWLKSPKWYKEQKIELILGKKAISLDADKKIIGLDDNEQIEYEKLLLAIGGSPRKWPVKGAEKEGVLYLRALDDYKKIKETLKSAKHIVIIGSGSISFEMSDILRLAGYEVTVVMIEPHYNGFVLDEISGKIIEEALEKGGVKIKRSAEVKEVLGGDKAEGVVLKDGSQIQCDAIICGIGIFCCFDWLKNAGLEINKGILANEYLETNKSGIWTAGDAAEFNDLILEEKVLLGNWLNAQMQGKIAGINMVGKKTPFKLVSSYSSHGFGTTITFVGDIRSAADRLVIQRGQARSKSHGQIIIKDDEIIGATLVNSPADLFLISKLIENNIKVVDIKKELGDPNFNLKKLL